MDAPLMYMSRFSVSPAGKKPLFDWLDGGHCVEVISQPGFIFYKRVKLDQKSEDGWESYVMLYGLESRQALEDYFANKALHEKFTRQRAPFAEQMRMDRFWGDVEASEKSPAR